MAARSGAEPKTLRLKVIDSTNAPSRRTNAATAHLPYTFIFYNCTNCDKLHVKICSDPQRCKSLFEVGGLFKGRETIFYHFWGLMQYLAPHDKFLEGL